MVRDAVLHMIYRNIRRRIEKRVSAFFSIGSIQIRKRFHLIPKI
jgi:hypothetical protein